MLYPTELPGHSYKSIRYRLLTFPSRSRAAIWVANLRKYCLIRQSCRQPAIRSIHNLQRTKSCFRIPGSLLILSEVLSIKSTADRSTENYLEFTIAPPTFEITPGARGKYMPIVGPYAGLLVSCQSLLNRLIYETSNSR